ncbi:MAG: hypothetical protein CVU34_16655 [Betaproteobacteria bacterium HGW-Betaproteobacteria-7]|jgi:glycosyltransferase involved in cell wall biosynthesis|nr:MAG: hypothetical protein CVU34_16655 [Betaproteobacteria bacterium HGW-Betaproteobacteria-7]
MVEARTAAFVMPYFGDSAESGIYLSQAVTSVFEQSDPDWMLFIVDDSSPNPLTFEMLGERADLFKTRIVLLRTSARSGPGVCRNIAIQHAYDYGCVIALFLDADDIAFPDRLKATRMAMAPPDVDVVYSVFKPIDGAGEVLPSHALVPSIASILKALEDPPEGPETWLTMATEVGYTNLTSATAVKTSIAISVPFPPEMVSEDFHTWLRIGAAGASFSFLNTPLCGYRIATTKSGSSSRRRYGPEFYRKKAQIDSRGFEEALLLALRRGTLSVEVLPLLRKKFRQRLAGEMRSEGEVSLANELEHLPSEDTCASFFETLGAGRFGLSTFSYNNDTSLAGAISVRAHASDRGASLHAMLDFAVKSVPFYRDQWLAEGPPLFDALPHVCREDVSFRMLDLCADDLGRHSRIFRHRSSGTTTGEPVTGLMDEHDWQMNLVSIVDQLKRLGFSVDSAEFGRWSFLQVTVYPHAIDIQLPTDLPNKPVWRRLNIPAQENARDSQLEALSLLIAVLQDAPCVLNGMPSALVRVAAMLRHYFPDAYVKPLLIFSSGEALTEPVRQELQAYFRVPVYSLYAVGEVGCVGYECVLQNGFHLESHRLWVEVEDCDGPGEIIATTLKNTAMPLVRYRTGDIAERILEPCPCGDSRIRIGPIIGRSHEDYLAMLNQVTAI